LQEEKRRERKLKKNVPSINSYISMTGMYRCKLVMSKKVPQGRRSWDPTFLLRQWYRWPRTEIGRRAQSSTNYTPNKIYKFPIHNYSMVARLISTRIPYLSQLVFLRKRRCECTHLFSDWSLLRDSHHKGCNCKKNVSWSFTRKWDRM